VLALTSDWRRRTFRRSRSFEELIDALTRQIADGSAGGGRLVAKRFELKTQQAEQPPVNAKSRAEARLQA
jgi:hypothetical protein